MIAIFDNGPKKLEFIIWPIEIAFREAEAKLWQQPGAEAYHAQLGRIVMYRIENFRRSGDIYIDSDIQERALCPFTLQCAKSFFDNFQRESFAFEGKVGSIRIYDGKQVEGRHSYAFGWLFSETIDEIMQRHGTWPEQPVGTINFECGGNATAPCTFVQPDPPGLFRVSSDGQ